MRAEVCAKVGFESVCFVSFSYRFESCKDEEAMYAYLQEGAVCQWEAGKRAHRIGGRHASSHTDARAGGALHIPRVATTPWYVCWLPV